jgi:hypothetical protein
MDGAPQVAMRVTSQTWQIVFASQTLQVFCFCFANPSGFFFWLRKPFKFFFLLRKPFRFFVFASQTLHVFRLALHKKAQHVVVHFYI